MRELVLALAFTCLAASTAAAEELVISGRVLDTSGTANEDRPLSSVVVEILDSGGGRLRETTTQSNGRFHIRFDDKAKLTGKEILRIDAAGYSARPTRQPIKLERPQGMKLADQGDFLLTNTKAIRDDVSYRDAVAKSVVAAQADPRLAERAKRAFASISALPDDSRGVAFGSVKALSGPAYAELLKVDGEATKARAAEADLKQQGLLVLPLHDSGGKIRLTGSVASKQEMDAVLLRVEEKGYKRSIIINDLQLKKPPTVRP